MINAVCNLCGSRRAEPFISKDGFDLVRCTQCDLLFVANPPTDEERARLYSSESG